MNDNVTTLRAQPQVTPRHKLALQCAINSILAVNVTHDHPRGYVTLTDAGMIFSITSILMQSADTIAGTELASQQTQGTSAQTAASVAVEKALQENS